MLHGFSIIFVFCLSVYAARGIRSGKPRDSGSIGAGEVLQMWGVEFPPCVEMLINVCWSAVSFELIFYIGCGLGLQLVQVLKESFKLYRAINDGIINLVDKVRMGEIG